MVIRTRNSTSGDACPGVRARQGISRSSSRRSLVRIVGQAPLAATVFEMERLRCNACGQVFTAEEPEGIGPEKYDATAAAMIAQLKYGSGVPFTRLERTGGQMGIPLPAATQWELVEDAARMLRPALEATDLAGGTGRGAPQRRHGMRILRLAREPSDKRTGIFTSGIVSLWQDRKIALFFTGRQHAGENLADVLKQRAPNRSCAHPDVRCAVAKHAEADERSEDPAGELPGSRKAAVCGCGRELSRRSAGMCWKRSGWFTAMMPWRASRDLNAEQRLQFHQQYSAAADGPAASMAGRAAGGDEDGAELRAG